MLSLFLRFYTKRYDVTASMMRRRAIIFLFSAQNDKCHAVLSRFIIWEGITVENATRYCCIKRQYRNIR